MVAEGPEAPAAEDVAIGDANNDGWLDFAVATMDLYLTSSGSNPSSAQEFWYTGNYAVLLNQKNGTFPTPISDTPEEEISGRLEIAPAQLAEATDLFDHIVVNVDLDEATEEVANLIIGRSSGSLGASTPSKRYQ